MASGQWPCKDCKGSTHFHWGLVSADQIFTSFRSQLKLKSNLFGFGCSDAARPQPVHTVQYFELYAGLVRGVHYSTETLHQKTAYCCFKLLSFLLNTVLQQLQLLCVGNVFSRSFSCSLFLQPFLAAVSCSRFLHPFHGCVRPWLHITRRFGGFH